ncbi:MAG: hypothetical protein MUC95_10120 [Spirochaetes bacterium]|nr:hypothetical protein [Spirochaetota bacterium]
MHLLRIISLIILICMISLVSCKQEGPLTPDQAFDELKDAYNKKDAAAVIGVLSGGSVEKIKGIIGMISSMNEVQLKSLSERLGATVDEMKKLDVRGYMSLQFKAGEKTGDNMMGDILKHKIIGIDTNKDKAMIRLDNGMELPFIREGGYWKFNMKDL